MRAKLDKYQEVRLESEAACDWLRDHYMAVNAKWKCIDIQWFGQTHEQFQDENGTPRKYICPARYILTYYRTRFRLFGGSEEAVISFSESDILSVLFRRELKMAFWDAHYSLHIGLKHGQIEINYTPPFFGVTPVANARHSENMHITYDLHYTPEKV
jgi:hypothetical protein